MIAKRSIGRTSAVVSTLGFGGAPLGNLYREVSDRDAATAIAAALHAGIRYVDTAPHYGLGLSEQRLGAALAGHARSSFTVSTKVGRTLVRNQDPAGSDLSNGFAVPDDSRRVVDFSSDGIRRSVGESLDRLGLDSIDIAFVHDPDEALEQTIREALPALTALRDEGVVHAIGVGMNFWQPLQVLVKESELDVVMIAGRWTLLDRSASPLLETCLERDVAVVAAAPFNSGILASTDIPETSTFNYGQATSKTLEAARRLAATCLRHDVELPAAALQFPLRHQAVVSVVCGMRTAEEVVANASLFTKCIPQELWQELDAETPMLR